MYQEERKPGFALLSRVLKPLLCNLTLRQKLVSIIMFTCTVALVVAGLTFASYQHQHIQAQMAKRLRTEAEMIGPSVAAALTCDVVKDAEDSLRAFRAEPSIVFACIYDQDRRIFAKYSRAGEAIETPRLAVQQQGYGLTEEFMIVSTTIKLEDEVIGSVSVWSDLEPLQAMFRRHVLILLAVLALALAVAYLVSAGVQGVISQPILDLADTVKTVSEKREYSTRAQKTTRDEVGLLIDSFNAMLEQIQARDVALVKANAQLEGRVDERTAELKTANEDLDELNEDLEELIEELKRSNRELNDFAYVTAHDLKGPLRAIGTLADWVHTDYADKLEGQGRKYMQLIKGRVSRMNELIDGILRYAEIGRRARRLEPIDLNDLVSETVAVIDPPANIEIVIDDPLPTVTCRRIRFVQVFQNLIDNAIKFMDKPQGRIEMGCHDRGDQWEFYVRDNGPGIEARYHEKVFGVFQTLAPRDEFESTGIGLSVVKKIVELSGGQVWIESEPGQGSTFRFTLPKSPTQTDRPRSAHVATKAGVV